MNPDRTIPVVYPMMIFALGTGGQVVKENFYRRLPFLRSRFYRFVSEGISRFDKISVEDSTE